MTRRLVYRTILDQEKEHQKLPHINFYIAQDKIKNIIPGEIIVLYSAGFALLPPNELTGHIGWLIFCLVAVFIQFARQTKYDPKNGEKKDTDWTHVLISCVSYLLWVYSLGGPFMILNLHIPWLSGLLLLGWNFVIAPLYPGPKEN